MRAYTGGQRNVASARRRAQREHRPPHDPVRMTDDRRHPKDGSKPTFSELDKRRRERASGGGRRDGESRGGRDRASSGHAQSSYRAALEQAFASGKLDELAQTLRKASVPAPPATVAAPAPRASAEPAGNGTPEPAPPAAPSPPPDPEQEERRKLLDKLKAAEGRDDITRAVDRWLARYERLPRDYDLYAKALSHRDDAVLLAIMEQLACHLEREKPRRARALTGQLRLIEDTHDDPDIRDRAAKLRAALA
jgi:hypothetical protein